MPPRNEVDKICEYAKELGDKDLEALLTKLDEESARRERRHREEDWSALRYAIAAYIAKWGTIQVYDDEHSVNITYRSDLSSIGEIDATY